MKNRTTRVRKESAAQNNEIGYAVDFVELIYRVAAGWKFICILALTAVMIAVVYTELFVSPEYEATSTLYVLSRDDDEISMADVQLSSALTQDYIKVFQLWEIHEAVISKLELPYSYADMRKMLSVTNDADTRMIDITVTAGQPIEAADIANEYARVVSRYVVDIMGLDKPTIVSAALIPSMPVRPNMLLHVMIGVMAGAVLGIGWIIVRTLLEDTCSTAEESQRFASRRSLADAPLEDATAQEKDGRSP